MMDMLQRNELINALDARGFEELNDSQITGYGWTFTHEDGFTLKFDAGGRFSLILPDGKRNIGVMSQPSDVLSIIDNVAGAL